MIVTLSYSLIKDSSDIDLPQRTTIALGLGVVVYGILIYQLSGREKMVNVSLIGLAVVDFLAATYEFYKDSCKDTCETSPLVSEAPAKRSGSKKIPQDPLDKDSDVSDLSDSEVSNISEVSDDESDTESVASDDEDDGIMGSNQLSDKEKEEIMTEIKTMDPIATQAIAQLNADVQISLDDPETEPTVTILPTLIEEETDAPDESHEDNVEESHEESADE